VCGWAGALGACVCVCVCASAAATFCCSRCLLGLMSYLCHEVHKSTSMQLLMQLTPPHMHMPRSPPSPPAQEVSAITATSSLARMAGRLLCVDICRVPCTGARTAAVQCSKGRARRQAGEKHPAPCTGPAGHGREQQFCAFGQWRCYLIRRTQQLAGAARPTPCFLCWVELHWRMVIAG